MVIVKHPLLSIPVVRATSLWSNRSLLLCHPAQDAQQTQGQLVQQSRSVVCKVELLDEGMKIYAKPQQSWSYMIKSNQPETSVYSARSLGS